MPRRNLAALLCAAVLAVAGTSFVHAQGTVTRTVRAPVSIEIQAMPLESFDRRDKERRKFGDLLFRSGLVLKSSYSRFGGISAIRLDAKGEGFIAISDKADWFTGRITYRGKEMTGLQGVETAPMLGAHGRPLTARGWYDSEGLAIDGTTLYVGIERANRLVRFDFRNGGIQSRAEEVAVPPAYRRLPNNEGPEALMFVPSGAKLAGALIVLSERGLDAAGNILGFLIGGPSPGEFAIKRTDGYDISDAALLPDGDIVLLERKFSLRHGVGIRVRRIAIDGVKPGATIDGPTLMEADLGYEIDNMEGIDAHRTESGETVLTLISDDNFSFLQRTLILQFTLIEP
jgi:hypothetical protein